MFNPHFRPMVPLRTPRMNGEMVRTGGVSVLGGRMGGGPMGGPGMMMMGAGSPPPDVPVDTTIGRPEGVVDDPRAKKGKVSYNDWDANVPDGEVVLDY